MARTKNKNKNKAVEKHQLLETEKDSHIGENNQAAVVNTEKGSAMSESKPDNYTNPDNGTTQESVPSGDHNKYDIKKECQPENNVEDDMEENLSDLSEGPETFVDQTMAFVQRSRKLWVVMGFIAAVLGALANMEVADDQLELLIIDKAVALSNTRAQVFQYISDMSRYKEWYPGVAEFKPTDAFPIGIGKHYIEVLEVPLWGPIYYTNVVTSYESPKYISFICDSWMKLRTEIVLEREEDSRAPTRLKYRIYSRAKSYMFRYMGLPAIKLMYSNRVRQAMFNLRFILQ